MSAHERPDRPESRPPAASERPPTADELLVMAYVDHELSPRERAEFEARCEREPALARELALQRGLDVLAREVAPREPEDHEWARFTASPLGRLQRVVGWVLIVVVPVLAIAALEFFVWRESVAPFVRWGVTILVGLGLTYFLLALRARLTTRPYDPYTGVRR